MLNQNALGAWTTLWTACALSLAGCVGGNDPSQRPQDDGGLEAGTFAESDDDTSDEDDDDEDPDDDDRPDEDDDDDDVADDDDFPFPDDAGPAFDAGPKEDGGGPEEATECVVAVSSEPLRARSSVMSSEVSAGAELVFTSELFNAFAANCGACHVDTNLGGFQVDFDGFSEQVTQEVLAVMQSDDPEVFMPPAAAQGVPFSERAEGDPVRELAGGISEWLQAGSPSDFYAPENEGTSSEDGPYLLSEQVGQNMTNLGNCIPPRRSFGVQFTRMLELDAQFEQMTELPERLEETDLFTLDSEVLGQHATVAFAPGYPLWSDDAGKLRHVRVPIGETIRFDAERQSFEIPPNTRFYKTFLKRVVDSEGVESYRKVETRIIVARPDGVLEDGSVETRALYGSYAWSEDERGAVLVKEPLRNGEPFADVVRNVILDEVRAQEVIDSAPANLEQALEREQLIRRYAIPGSDRCVQCHMGSPGASFILGFTPLQIHRRPAGEGGVIEPSERDELNQLQRLIDYGVVSGLSSPDEVVPLEDSQGDRKPRTEQELIAQGYMLANCAGCHNPRGFPTVTNPELRDLLHFLPGRDEGGIFEFPLERFSPRIKRGQVAETRIPYITPSLYDLRRSNTETWADKEVDLSTIDGERFPQTPVLAPWRSLIYRNVDTPFTYSDDFAMYPHMPLHVPGYDCRAPRIMGEWMVSVPARHKPDRGGVSERDSELEQPYEEVLPEDAEYEAAAEAAVERLAAYQAGFRHDYCPNTGDIVDPEVLRGDVQVPQSRALLLDEEQYPFSSWDDGVPDRAHWTSADLSNAPGDWNPRRLDWQEAWADLRARSFEDLDGDARQEKLVIEMLDSVTISDELRQYALTRTPYGLWSPPEGCGLSGVRTLSSFQGEERPPWMDKRRVSDAERGVYYQSPGGAVFTTICSNCHGTRADSQSNLANTILQITGGNTRVANLRDGIFGMAGQNRARVFSEPARALGIGTDDLAGRYLVWMGLGGTQRVIPRSALVVVNAAAVLGEARTGVTQLPEGSANMLTAARSFCEQSLPAGGSNAVDFDIHSGSLEHDHPNSGTRLMEQNGDADMWLELCSIDNPPPIRVLRAGSWADANAVELSARRTALHWATTPSGAPTYPADVPIGDHHGRIVTGLQSDNLLPWCVQAPTDSGELEIAEQWASQVETETGRRPPFCPEQLLETFGGVDINLFGSEDVERWALRGAMNAGLAVFLYLDGISRGEIVPSPPYNECPE